MSTSLFASRHRLIVIGAASTLAAGTFVATNLAGAASGPSAIDYSQCSNVVPVGSTSPCVWINGILNSGGSNYHEDDATPQRLLVSVPESPSNPTHTHSVDLKYLDRKGAIHAYDALTDADLTIKTAASDAVRCQGLGAVVNVCPSTPAALTDVQPVVHDPTVMNGTVEPGGNGSNTVSSHEPTGDQLRIFGATFAPTYMTYVGSNGGHDNNCATCTGDDYVTVRITFITPSDGLSSHNVQLLFGGHLAPGASLIDGWGSNFGSASVSGGPYHIKWAAADGSSVGNRDNQIMSGAIQIVAAGGSIVTTPNVTDATVGASSLGDLTDSAKYKPDSGIAPTGTITFTLYGPMSSATDCTTVVYQETGDALSSTPDANGYYTANSTSGVVNLSAADPGTYSWVAQYVPGTDPYNKALSDTCGNELVTIDQNTPTATSTQTVTDTVTVTGVGTLTGTVTFDAYAGDSTCTSTDPTVHVLNQLGVGLDANNQATSNGVTDSSQSGTTTYYWQVTYSGDTDNAQHVVEACGVQTAALHNHS